MYHCLIKYCRAAAYIKHRCRKHYTLYRKITKHKNNNVCFDCNLRKICFKRSNFRCRKCLNINKTSNLVYYRKHKLRKDRYSIRWAKNNKTKVRGYRYKQRYGVSLEWYGKKLKEQRNVCAICQKLKRDSLHRILSVDHDHKTGNVRGLLCVHCNKGLGMFFDSPLLLKRAVKYIIKFKDISERIK